MVNEDDTIGIVVTASSVTASGGTRTGTDQSSGSGGTGNLGLDESSVSIRKAGSAARWSRCER